MATTGEDTCSQALVRGVFGGRKEMRQRLLETAQLALADAEIEVDRVELGRNLKGGFETFEGARHVALAIADETEEEPCIDAIRVTFRECARPLARLDQLGLDRGENSVDLGL